MTETAHAPSGQLPAGQSPGTTEKNPAAGSTAHARSGRLAAGESERATEYGLPMRTAELRAALLRALGPAVFESWVADVAIVGRSGQRLDIALGSGFRAAWVDAHLRDRIEEVAAALFGAGTYVRVRRGTGRAA